MACITALEDDPVKGVWVGTSVRTGDQKIFRTLDDYRQYVKSLEEQGTYCANVEPISNIRYTAGKETTPTGFLQFRPRDPVTQAKYDPFSKTWEGVASSERAVAAGLYSLDSAETTRRELREQVKVPMNPLVPPKPTEQKSCCIQ